MGDTESDMTEKQSIDTSNQIIQTTNKQQQHTIQQYSTTKNSYNQFPAYPSNNTQNQEDLLLQQQKVYAASGIPVGLQYPVSTLTVEVGTDISTLGLKPTLQSTGAPCSFTVFPTLPVGVHIDTST